MHGKNTYLSDKVSLHFPKETHEFFVPFKGRHLAIDVSRKDKTILITLTELDEDLAHDFSSVFLECQAFPPHHFCLLRKA